jgi:hypothetical protein
MAYHVTINFKRGPSVVLDIYATSPDAAKEAAKVEAPLWGFDAPIKNVSVRPA